jgi:xylan 1,4-beta-xylosidase
MSIKPFTGNINFNAQHAPMGAFMSFTCGHFGSGGGIGVEIGKPANQNLFIGVKSGDRTSAAPIRCLPFLRNSQTVSAADYQVEHAAAATVVAQSFQPYQSQVMSRHYGWGTDEWVTPDFTFSLYTPFGTIPDPVTAPNESMRAALLPAVVATLRVDNRDGATTKTALFAIDFLTPGARVLSDGGAVGFAWRRSMGLMAAMDAGESDDAGPAPFAFQRWSPVEGVADVNPVHALGLCGGVAVEVPPGTVRTLVLAIGVFLDGVVTTGLDGRYFYTRYYSSLQDVLTAALADAAELRGRAARLDAQLISSGLSPDQQFLLAHATRSYYGSTQLLDVGGEPLWVVNEGEYCMMNTLDLSVDQAFWELRLNPWVVRNLLDNFVQRYMYVDELQAGGGRCLPGGVSFAHDMGVNNNFSAPGYSSYELPQLTGCFSYMTAEQLCNWILTAACYVSKTADESWLRHNAATIRACLDSLIARGGESGQVLFDTARCEGGQEITTYDSLDASLAQTRNNVYMAVKCWASYFGLALLFEVLGDSSAADLASDRARSVAATVVANVGPDGVIPAIFERNNPGHASRILPAAEGLVYPLYWEQSGLAPARLAELLETPATKQLVEALRRHTRALLLDAQRRNLFPDGGVRLSSTSGNSWMSKIALFQHVARGWFGADEDPEIAQIFATADAAHVKWQTDGSGYWACSDQFVHGVAKGSRYYPRIITTALWMNPPAMGPVAGALPDGVLRAR